MSLRACDKVPGSCWGLHDFGWVTGSLSGTVKGYQEVCHEMWPGSRKSAGIVAREQDDCQGAVAGKYGRKSVRDCGRASGSLSGTVAGNKKSVRDCGRVIGSLPETVYG